MGGRPRWCVVNLAAPATTAAADLAAISRGLAAAAVAAGARLVGGNLSRARELSIAVALIGDAPPRPLTRAGARPGDLLFVTGTLGDAALGLRALRRDGAARGAAARRFRAPDRPTRRRRAAGARRPRHGDDRHQRRPGAGSATPLRRQRRRRARRRRTPAVYAGGARRRPAACPHRRRGLRVALCRPGAPSPPRRAARRPTRSSHDLHRHLPAGGRRRDVRRRGRPRPAHEPPRPRSLRRAGRR